MADTISPATAAPDASLPSDALSTPDALGTHDEQALLIELEPEAGRLYDRHAKVAQEWFPHDYIPYRLGRDFDKEPWTPDQPRLTGVAQTAFEIGLLTEDNLPELPPAHPRDVRAAATGRGSTGSAAGPPRRAATRSSCATT